MRSRQHPGWPAGGGPRLRWWVIPFCFFLVFAVSPQFRPVDEAGYRTLLNQHSGKIILVDFWASWCEPCREEMPSLVKLARHYTPQGLRFVTVSIDGPGELVYAEKFLKAQGAPFPAYYKSAKNDERFITSVDRRWSGVLPALFFYGRDGKLVKSYLGETDAGTVEATVRELLGPPSPAPSSASALALQAPARPAATR